MSGLEGRCEGCVMSVRRLCEGHVRGRVSVCGCGF